jgi:hypothetical protein
LLGADEPTRWLGPARDQQTGACGWAGPVSVAAPIGSSLFSMFGPCRLGTTGRALPGELGERDERGADIPKLAA